MDRIATIRAALIGGPIESHELTKDIGEHLDLLVGWAEEGAMHSRMAGGVEKAKHDIHAAEAAIAMALVARKETA